MLSGKWNVQLLNEKLMKLLTFFKCQVLERRFKRLNEESGAKTRFEMKDIVFVP